MTYILETENLDFSYINGSKALKNVSIKIPTGKKIAIIGNNGSGKSTLFLHFNGIHKPDSGQVILKGKKLDYSSNSSREAKKNVGLVFQDPDNQLFSGSVYQDVSYGPVNLGWSEEEVREAIKEAMVMTGTWSLRDRPTHFLSYGQKKRVAIAGVLAMKPELIVLDEPTAGLDPLFTSEIMRILDKLNQSGATVIISSHNLEEVYAWADYVFILKEGELISQGRTEEVFLNEDLIKSANLKKPWVLELYEKILPKLSLGARTQVPRTREEIIKLIEEEIKND